jgi:hypothetical protein
MDPPMPRGSRFHHPPLHRWSLSGALESKQLHQNSPSRRFRTNPARRLSGFFGFFRATARRFSAEWHLAAEPHEFGYSALKNRPGLDNDCGGSTRLAAPKSGNPDSREHCNFISIRLRNPLRARMK